MTSERGTALLEGDHRRREGFRGHQAVLEVRLCKNAMG